MENKEKKNIYYRLLIISAIIIPVIIGISYAYFLAIVKGTNNPTTIEGTVVDKMLFDLQTENNGYINATELIPLTNDQISEYAETGTFKVVTGNNKYFINYTLSLTDVTLPSELQNAYFKWRLVCTSCTDTSKNAEGNFANVSGTDMELKSNLLIDSSSQDEYKLMIWLQESNDNQISTMNKTFSAKVKAIGEFVNTQSSTYVPNE